MSRIDFDTSTDVLPEFSERPAVVSPAADKSTEVVITPSHILRGLLGGMLLLLAANVAVQIARHWLGMGHVYGLWRMFDVSQEANIPTYFSGLLLLSAALLFFVIGRRCAVDGRPFARHWLIFALLFAFLSFDEVAMVHELIGSSLMQILGDQDVPNGLRWTIIYLVAVLAVVVWSLRFYLHLNWTFRLLFGLAGVVFVLGAAGLEIVAGSLIMADAATKMRTFIILFTVEELMEMLGVIILIYAQLRWLADARSRLLLSFAHR